MNGMFGKALLAGGVIACVAVPLAPCVGSATASTVGGALFRPGPDGVTPGVVTTSEESENWSGYIRSGSSGAFSTSTASWTVPTVSTAHKGYSSTWVGIDGATSGDNYLIQTGTEADVVNGAPSYYCWWEVITPSDEAPEVRYNTPVHPGDTITASVTEKSQGTWLMSLTNHTSGVTSSHTATYNGPGKSAEWIQEDTDVNGVISPAPDWHSVKFHNITTDGGNPDLRAGDKVVIVDDVGTQEDKTSAPNSADSGFTVTWIAAGTGSPT